MKKICIITAHYPTEASPKYTFVDQLVCAFADMGIECIVICPASITSSILRKEKPVGTSRIRLTPGGNEIKIITPPFISFSSKKLFGVNTSLFTLNHFIRAVIKAYRKLNYDFDAVYGHFIFPSAITASKLSSMYNIPAFLAYGENTTYTIDYLGDKKTKNLLENISGVISVSSENKRVLIEHDLFSNDDIEVFPNGIDSRVFYQRDKMQMRRKYGFPKDSFIIAFVGYFIHIKGADRLSAAINKIGSDKINSVFIGTGEIGPTCDGILLKARLPHDEIPEVLSACDIFVLPTINEGCCNAIIEAMACGLPVISSNLPFNDDILDESCSLRIDTSNIDQIAAAIEKLYNDPLLRQRLSEGALKKSRELNINVRAKGILEYIEYKSNS